jgi:hypothetical protein
VKELFEDLTQQMMKTSDATKMTRKRPPLPIKEKQEQEYCKCCEN